MSLNNKFRFKTLLSIKGNDVAVKQLIKKLESGDIPECILITGDYGTGKTSLARAIKRYLHVDDEEYTEINCGKFRGIDTAREIIDNMQFRPQTGKYRIWLIDEAHRMTTDFQDAVLKATEEPPKHVIFIFSTNNPSKFTKGFRRRCFEIELKSLDKKDILNLLIDSVELLDENIPKKLLESIADKASGSAGVAYKLLEGIMGLSPDDANRSIARYDDTEIGAKNLCQLLIKRDIKQWSSIVECLKELEKNEQDAESVRRCILGYCKACYSTPSMATKIYLVSSAFERNVYDSGYPGLYNRCFEALQQ